MLKERSILVKFYHNYIEETFSGYPYTRLEEKKNENFGIG